MLVEHNCPVCGIYGKYETEDPPRVNDAVDCRHCFAALFISEIVDKDGDVWAVECENESGV